MHNLLQFYYVSQDRAKLLKVLLNLVKNFYMSFTSTNNAKHMIHLLLIFSILKIDLLPLLAFNCQSIKLNYYLCQEFKFYGYHKILK